MKKIIIMIIFISFTFLNFIKGNFLILNLINFSSVFKDRINIIVFKNKKSSSIGLLIYKDIEMLNNPYIIRNKNKEIKCYTKLEGWYLNVLRGNYIIPIHTGTNKIKIRGGLFTNCEGYTGSIIGQVSFNINNKNIGYILAGFPMDIKNNIIYFDSGFTNSLILYNGIRPIGLIYDNISGVGFIGNIFDINTLSEVLKDINYNLYANVYSSGKNIIIGNGNNKSIILFENNSGLSNNLIFPIFINGGYSFSSKDIFKSDITKYQILNILGSIDNDIFQRRAFFGRNVNISDIFNKLNKKVNILCKDRWKVSTNDIIFDGIINKLGKITCIDSNGHDINIVIDYDFTEDNINPKLIVKGGVNKVIFKKSMESNNYIEVYNKKGYILFYNDKNNLSSIDIKGKVNYYEGITSGFMAKGNFIVNGLIGGAEEKNNDYEISNFKHKLYLYGSIISLNSLGIPKESRINYLRQILNSSNINVNNISLLNIFSWRCKKDGIGNDGFTKCNNLEDKFRNFSLIIFKKKFSDKIMLLK